jgi:hypothetical protein
MLLDQADISRIESPKLMRKSSDMTQTSNSLEIPKILNKLKSMVDYEKIMPDVIPDKNLL